MPIAAFIVLTFGYLAVGFSRLVMGVHSLNQVLDGFVVGFWTLAYVLKFWRPMIKAHVEQMKQREMDRQDAVRLLIYVWLFCFAQVVVLSAIYLIVMDSYKMPDKYQANIRKCKPDFDESRLALENLFVVGLSMLPAGVYCGVYRRYYVVGDRLAADNGIGRSMTWCSILKKIVFSIIVFAPSLILFGLCVAFKRRMNIILNMVIGCALPSFTLGMSVFGGYVE